MDQQSVLPEVTTHKLWNDVKNYNDLAHFETACGTSATSRVNDWILLRSNSGKILMSKLGVWVPGWVPNFETSPLSEPWSSGRNHDVGDVIQQPLGPNESAPVDPHRWWFFNPKLFWVIFPTLVIGIWGILAMECGDIGT